MLPFKGRSNFRNTWPPAQASSCGNLSTLQPTGCHEKNPMSQRRSNDVTRRSNVRFRMEKMVRFDDLKSQNHQNPERRSFWIEAFHSDLRSSDPPGVRRGQFQCSFATGPRGPLGLRLSYRKTHQDTSRHIKMASPIGSPIGSPGLR